MASNKPVPFISLDAKTNRLHVTEQAKKYLSSVKGTVGVACVAGVYRTGKSYILNQLSGAAPGCGFGIGSSVQACTKGIWCSLAPIASPAPGAPKHLLILDTEGLQSICQTEGHDAKIFSLALLLSSFFIYNSEKAINNAAIDQLSLVAQLTQRIRVHAEGSAAAASPSSSEAALAEFFPKFVWLLRDFQLELEAANGEQMTPGEYLEECLRPQPGKSAAVAEQNQTRAAIRSLFSDRSCIALPHPTLGTTLPPSALKSMPALDKLAPGFRTGVTALKADLLSSLRPKCLGGKALSGSMLVGLAESYVAAINDGALPTISTAWQAVITLESTRALTEATQLYSDGARAALAKPEMLDERLWMREHVRLSDLAIRHYRAIAVGESADGSGGGQLSALASSTSASADGFEAKLRDAIDAERARTEELLSSRSTAQCDKLASALGETLAAYLRSAAGTPRDAASGLPHSERLPKLLGELQVAYEAQAVGHGKAQGRAALNSRLLPAVGEAMRALESRAAEAAKDAKGSVDRVVSLGKDLDACRKDLEATRADLAAARTQLAEATSRAASVQKEAAAAANLSGKLTRERDIATQAASRLTADGHRLTSELEATREKLRAAEEKLVHADHHGKRSSESVSGLTAQLEVSTAEARQAKAELQAARAEAASARATEAALMEHHRSLDARATSLASQLAAKDEEIARLAEQLSSLPPQPAYDHLPAPTSGSTKVETAALAQEDDGNEQEEELEQSKKKRRSSVAPESLAVPALQAKLKALGFTKLPKKKADLLAMYMKEVQ